MTDMIETASFQELIRRVRERDEQAAAELVRRYEKHIRRTVRFRLVDPRLRRLFDTTDICQSVLASFFEAAARGRYDLEHAQQLIRLLVKMTCNKVAMQARRQHAQRRDITRLEPGCDAWDLVAPGKEPGEQVALAELVARFRQHLSEEEWRLLDERAAGREWAEIAATHGGTSEALRKRLARAVERVERQLNDSREES
jgi:RNA polymerase sigma-70 factor (ECF subfamily)